MKIPAIICLCSVMCAAQQWPQISHFHTHMLLYNPAAAGAAEQGYATMLYRKQFWGSPLSPVVMAAAIDMPFSHLRVGLGCVFIKKYTAVYEWTQASANYSYKINFIKGTLAMGIQAGIKSYIYNPDALNAKDPDENILKYNMLIPDFGTGLLYNTSSFFASISIVHLSAGALALSDNINYPLYRNYIFAAGKKFRLTEVLQLSTALMIRYEHPQAIQADIQAQIMFYSTAWAGLTYRTGHAVAIQSGINLYAIIKKIPYDAKIFYAFDILYAQNAALTQAQAHEIGISISFGKNLCGTEKRYRTHRRQPLHFCFENTCIHTHAYDVHTAICTKQIYHTGRYVLQRSIAT
ncbi:MAG: PorP/SprF family type IX secretion system membrane protein [Cytophagales bacterium]|nr:PorP/SprF family type IX secretion system membrane protein [Cytophagales bacterium]